MPPAFTATTKSPLVINPLDELLEDDELDEVLEEDELVLELLELLLVELLLVELLLELAVFPPPQPPNPMLVAISASDKTLLFADVQFMNVNHSVIDVLSGDLLSLSRTVEHFERRTATYLSALSVELHDQFFEPRLIFSVKWLLIVGIIKTLALTKDPDDNLDLTACTTTLEQFTSDN